MKLPHSLSRLALFVLLAAPSVQAATPATAPHTRDLVDTAVAGGFETLVQALTTAGLVDTLEQDGPFTVFAPTDEAFAALPSETLAALLRPENRDTLISVLTYHVVSGEVAAADAVRAGQAETLQGDDVRFSIEDGRLRVSGATVVKNDVRASNGVVHAIDSVLLPPGGLNLKPQGRLVLGVFTERPGRALAEQLRLDRHNSLLITRVVDGSTAQRAGLQPYDVILTIDGGGASDESLKRAKKAAGFMGLVDLEVLRRGQHVELSVPVGIERH